MSREWPESVYVYTYNYPSSPLAADVMTDCRAVPCMKDSKNFASELLERVRDYSKLSVENFRLILTEKLTLLLSLIAMAAVAAAFLLIMLFFISVCAATLLAHVIPLAWAFAIMAGIYLLLGIGVIVFRRQLLMDPIARFISRLILS